MDYDSFYDKTFGKTSSGYVDIHGDKVTLRDVVWINFGWGEDYNPRNGQPRECRHLHEVWVKKTYNERDPWIKIPMKRCGDHEKFGLSNLYDRPLKLNREKRRDLFKMRKFLPESYHEMYPEPDSSSSEEESSDDPFSDTTVDYRSEGDLDNTDNESTAEAIPSRDNASRSVDPWAFPMDENQEIMPNYDSDTISVGSVSDDVNSCEVPITMENIKKGDIVCVRTDHPEFEVAQILGVDSRVNKTFKVHWFGASGGGSSRMFRPLYEVNTSKTKRLGMPKNRPYTDVIGFVSLLGKITSMDPKGGIVSREESKRYARLMDEMSEIESVNE